MSVYAVEFNGVSRQPVLSGSAELLEFKQIASGLKGSAWAIATGEFQWDVQTDVETSNPYGNRHIVMADSKEDALAKINQWIKAWKDA